MTTEPQFSSKWIASGRNGYQVIEIFQTDNPGYRECPVGEAIIVRAKISQKDNEMLAAQMQQAYHIGIARGIHMKEMGLLEIPEIKPMSSLEMASGKYICVTPIHWIRHGGCTKFPQITIRENGVWIRSLSDDTLNPGMPIYSSAHKECFEEWCRQAEQEAIYNG